MPLYYSSDRCLRRTVPLHSSFSPGASKTQHASAHTSTPGPSLARGVSCPHAQPGTPPVGVPPGCRDAAPPLALSLLRGGGGHRGGDDLIEALQHAARKPR
jgi:hypothetical protein